MAEHAVIVRFQYGSQDLAPLSELEEQLDAAVEAAAAGEYDGNEIAVDGSDGFLYLYGPDADQPSASCPADEGVFLPPAGRVAASSRPEPAGQPRRHARPVGR